MKRNAKTNQTALFWILMLLILILAGFIFIRTTPSGVGMVSDSVNYINGARFIARGEGYYRESGGGTLKPITNFPPLYSILLSVPILFGIDEISAVWVFSFVFYVLNVMLTGLLIRRITGSSWLGLAASVLFTCSKPFLYFQVFAMSEPLFFFCMLLVFYLLAVGMESDDGFIWFLCGLFSGAAFLTRYVGAVSLAAVLVVLLFLSPPAVRKWKAALQVLAGALPLMAAWLIRNYLVSGNISNREALVHPLSVEDFKTGVLIFWRWFYPERYQTVENPVSWMQWGLILAGVLGILFLVLVWLNSVRKKHDYSIAVRMIWTFVIYIFGYLLMVYLTISYLDASVNIEERILYPCFLVLLLIFFSVAGLFIRRKYWILGTGMAVIYVFMIFSFSQDLLRFIPRFGEEGYGWAWKGWEDSPAMNLVRELPGDTVIYSNQPEAISLIAGRGSYALLDPIDPSSDSERPGYEETMQEIRRQVLDGESVLVFFGISAWIEPGQENWITELCEGLPYMYQDTSEWVLGKIEETK